MRVKQWVSSELLDLEGEKKVRVVVKEMQQRAVVVVAAKQVLRG